MKLSRLFSPLIISFCLITTVYGQAGKPVKDYLGLKGPIKFDNVSYNLYWTSHPADNFYKQEYVANGDNAEKFKTMILIDVITGDTKMEAIVGKKVLELKKLKENNPIVNYQLLQKDGETMLDFLLTASSADGKTIEIAEWNVYRYKKITNKSGQKAVLLFGVSKRGYGNDVRNFMKDLNTKRPDLLNKMGKFNIPEITLPAPGKK